MKTKLFFLNIISIASLYAMESKQNRVTILNETNNTALLLANNMIKGQISRAIKSGYLCAFVANYDATSDTSVQCIVDNNKTECTLADKPLTHLLIRSFEVGGKKQHLMFERDSSRAVVTWINNKCTHNVLVSNKIIANTIDKDICSTLDYIKPKNISFPKKPLYTFSKTEHANQDIHVAFIDENNNTLTATQNIPHNAEIIGLTIKKNRTLKISNLAKKTVTITNGSGSHLFILPKNKTSENAIRILAGKKHTYESHEGSIKLLVKDVVVKYTFDFDHKAQDTINLMAGYYIGSTEDGRNSYYKIFNF
ncbi:MAG: hypothetical protein WC707_03590 [Candidatus Babeliaceae bacterium]|jgi:hypothetical protein